MDIRAYNRAAWDHQVERENPWTRPVTAEEIANARAGRWQVVLTPAKPVPAGWFPPLAGKQVLCLASGGGQQGPILAAAGANVTVLDNSPRQLAQDRLVSEREGLHLTLVEGDMADLSAFADASFDLIFHPVSNLFAPHIRPVWQECARVLKPGGVLLAGFVNPASYIFDYQKLEAGEFVVRFSLPYSDAEQLPADELQKLIDAGEPLEFGHTLDDQIGGQLDAGLVLTGFFEDIFPGQPLSNHMPYFIATRAVKPLN